MTAEEVVARIERGWQELNSLAEKMDAEGLSMHRGPDGWAVKDHLVHVAAWEHWLLALFEHRDKLAAMGAPDAKREMDDVNAVVYEKHRDDSVEAALEYFRGSHEQLMAVMRRQSTENFERPYTAFF